MSIKRTDEELALPFFAHFLSEQETSADDQTWKYPSDNDELITKKYPSDGDEIRY